METLPGQLRRLPAGHDRSQVEMLSRDQRQRILAAAAEMVARRGYQGTTIEQIVGRAGVSRATFYENFANREDCLLACFAEGEAELRRRFAAAAAGVEGWPEQVCASLAAGLSFAAAEPALARTCLIEVITAGPRAMEAYERALQGFAPLFLAGRRLDGAGEELPETLEDSIVGGIVWMVHQRLLRGEIDEIPALLPTMLAFALGPYMGEEAAARFIASQGL